MKIRKRDGRIVAFDDSKITDAIFAAAQAVGGADREMAVEITLCVLKCLKAENKEIVDVEHVQDIVEKVLIKKAMPKRQNLIFCTVPNVRISATRAANLWIPWQKF